MRVSPDRHADTELRNVGLSEMPTGDVDMSAPLVLNNGVFALGSDATASAHAAMSGMAASPALLTGLGPGLLLALRFIQARFLSIWGLLVAAALCPAQVFADLAVFAALANFASIAALMRFDAVFFQNSDQARLGRAFRIALASCAAVICVLAVGILFASSAGWVLRGFGALFLISMACRALIRLLVAEATAEGDFATIGNSNIVQALVQPGMMILLIWPLGPTLLALLAADAFGHVVAAGYLAWRRRAALARLMWPGLWSWRELLQSAMIWRAAPRFLLPSALLSFGFMVAPLLALPLAGNPLLAAHVALAMRLLEMPTQMFASVSVPLVMNNLRIRDGHSRQEWARFITISLMAVAAVLFAAIAIVSLGVDAWLAGTQWHGVGQVIAVLALFYAGSALVAPLTEIGALTPKPQRQMVTNGIALAAAILIMVGFGELSIALLCAIGLVSLARMLAHAQFAWTRIGGGQMPAGLR